MGSVTVDAYAVNLSAAQRGDKKQAITEFLKSYAENTSQRRLFLADRLTQEEVVNMANFHFQYIKTLTEHYARWMLANLDEAKEAGNGPHSGQQSVALTSTETMRVTRAIYRFQLLCHLAGPGDNSPWLSRDHLDETVQAFLDTLEPWEVEELFSFYQFAHDVYDKIIKDIMWDLHPDNPKFNDQGRPPTPDGAFDLDGLNRAMYLEGTTLRGLPLLHTVLFKIKDREHIVSTMQQHMTKSNLYGWYISDDLRRWGYVFWDAKTLERIGGTKVLMRQWEEYWDDDPRDNLP
ncbi:hypothetical protein NKR23_g741 [Pleurostoma richardsiae]|uniref:Uncharacterized protein n=1 Tax=Pleurostoma richardsiae TaxID=41990 RepID=A0AA38VYF4_9PEZI|nr:hypothetical protein NKR23_g741 [Pleurostoma richardsiae]